MVRLVCLCLQHTNEGGETSSHHVVIEVVIWRMARLRKSPQYSARRYSTRKIITPLEAATSEVLSQLPPNEKAPAG
jgi:hypothetical protein